jgi:hypothetical protein
LAAAAIMSLDEIPDAFGQFAILQIAAPAQLVGVLRDVARPPLGGVKTENADRIFVLVGEQVRDDGFEGGMFVVRLAPNPAQPAQAVHDKADILIVTSRHDRRRPSGITHCSNSNATEAGLKAAATESFRPVGADNSQAASAQIAVEFRVRKKWVSGRELLAMRRI